MELIECGLSYVSECEDNVVPCVGGGMRVLIVASVRLLCFLDGRSRVDRRDVVGVLAVEDGIKGRELNMEADGIHVWRCLLLLSDV